MYIVHCILSNVYWKIYIVHLILFIVFCTVYTVYRLLYALYCALHTVYIILYTVQFIMYFRNGRTFLQSLRPSCPGLLYTNQRNYWSHYDNTPLVGQHCPCHGCHEWDVIPLIHVMDVQPMEVPKQKIAKRDRLPFFGLCISCGQKPVFKAGLRKSHSYLIF